jgi:REP element-mobilizing transposase RayT
MTTPNSTPPTPPTEEGRLTLRGSGWAKKAKVIACLRTNRAFVQLMIDANQRLAMRLTGYCLMPNHFHLLLWPYGDGDLSRWMQWLLTAHVRRYRHCHGSGHVSKRIAPPGTDREGSQWLGADEWANSPAAAVALEASLRLRGRPQKK